MKKIISLILMVLFIAACESKDATSSVSIQSLVMPADQSQYTSDVSLDLVIEDVNNPPKQQMAAFAATTLKQAGVLAGVNHSYTVDSSMVDANLTRLGDPASNIAMLKQSLETTPSEKLKISTLKMLGIMQPSVNIAPHM